jgi:sugar phosphate permease
MNDSTTRPAAVRHAIVAATTLTAVMLYLDRICIAFAERFIKEDLGLTNQQMGWVLSAFFWSYALGQVPSGWLADRFGGRVMLSLYVFCWSVLTMLTGVAGGLVGLLAARLAFGLAQAGAFPTSAGLLRQWVPFATRGTASSMVSFGGRIGGAVAPILTAALIVVFVPVRVSSRLTARDLLDAHKLSWQIVRPADDDAARLSRRVLDSVDGEFRRNATHLGDSYAAELKRIEIEAHHRGVRQESIALVLAAPGDDDRAILVAGLNRVLDRRDFFDEVDFADVPINREARSLARLPRDELSAEQLQRLNRLLLEAVYPDGIRKVYVAGWRTTMFVFGAAGVAVAALFWFVCRDRPALHPWSNPAEVELIESTRPAGEPRAGPGVRDLPMRYVLTNWSLWMSCVSQFGTNFGWVFLITWLPRYLQEVHRVPVLSRGAMASVPLFVGWLGMLTGGWLTDWLVIRVGKRWGRALPMSLSRFVAMSAFLACLFPVSPWMAVALLAVVAVSTDIGTPSAWAFMQDVGGRHVGSVLGWGNMWGNFGAAVSPLVLNWLVTQHKNWDAAFLACAAAFLLSGIAAAGVDATKPIVPATTEEATPACNAIGGHSRRVRR